MTGGFQPGNLIVIAARPSMGKSALVANIAENAVLDGSRGGAVLARDVRVRARPALRRLPGEDQGRGPAARQGRRGSAGRRSSRPASGSPSAPLYVDDSSDTGVLEVRAKARRLHHQLEGGLGLIIVDYLQLMRHEGRVESRVEQVGQISPRAEGPGARAGRAGDRALAAEPRGRAARRRQEADPLRPARDRARSSRTPTS